MNPIAAPLAAFNAAQAPTKAGIIAAMCGALGVLGGFVLYVVFTHLFEHGEAGAKIVGIAGGLAASVAIAWFGHRLWDAIDEGQIKLSLQGRRTLISAVALVIVFELSASAFEDLGRALSGDFGAIERVAANIAGRDTTATDVGITAEETAALLPIMRRELARMPPRKPATCTDCVKSPVLHLAALMPAEALYRVFANELQPADAELDEVFFKPASMFGRMDTACRAAPVHSRELVWSRFSAATEPRAEQIAACRNELMTAAEASRQNVLQQALNGVLARHDLYDAASFTVSADGEHLAVAESVRRRLETERVQCDAIRSATAGAPSCLAAVKMPTADPNAGRLSPVAELRALNRELLAVAFPGLIKPLPVFWWDLVALVLIWTTAAIVLGVYLAMTLFDEDGARAIQVKSAAWRLWIAVSAVAFASILAGLVLVAFRFVPFLWHLMFDAEGQTEFSIVAIVPWFVQWLGRQGIPGWITLPVIVGGLVVAWGQGEARRDDDTARFAGLALLGLLLTSIWPVAGGMIGVVLVVAGAWLVPAVGLSLLAPYLKPAVSLPQWWGVVALAGGLAIAFWVAAMLTGTDLFSRGVIAGAGLLAALTGVLILRQVTVRELWPLLALTTGLTLVGGSAALQQLTFAGALKELHPVSQARYGDEKPSQLELLYYLRVVRPQQEEDKIPPAFQAPPADDTLHEALRLELALTGSIGFWLTISMLVAWSLKLGPTRAGHANAAEAPSA